MAPPPTQPLAYLLLDPTAATASSLASGGGAGGGGGLGAAVTVTPKEIQEMQKALENTNVEVKIDAMKRLLRLTTNGVQLPQIIMTVIRYAITTDNHELKKLLLLYWESLNKLDEHGQLKPEMVLVTNSILSDLNHPNEYIRGCTLRMLCRIQEVELISHLVEPIKANLTYRHAYVRRQAAFCLATIRKRFGEELVPDVEELLEQQLTNESEGPTRRDIFLALFQVDPDRAVRFFTENSEQIPKFGDAFALVSLELARRTCKADPTQKARFVKTIFQLLQSESPAVIFEAAWTLTSLSSAPTAVRAACGAYTHLLHIDSDNNVKLVVLEKLAALQRAHPKILQESLMDVLRALSSPNTDIRSKTLDIAMELVTPTNVEEVVLVLKKEVVKTQSKEMDREEAAEYRKLLVRAIHSCAVKFPAVAGSVVHVLMDFLNGEGAIDVVVFVRELAESQPSMRAQVVEKLVDCLGDVRASNVARGAMWILGEYAETPELMRDALDAVFEALGPLPIQPTITAGGGGASGEPSKVELTTTVTVLPDGTYATQTALTESTKGAGGEDDEDGIGGPRIRRMILEGDYFLGAVAVVTLAKLSLRLADGAAVLRTVKTALSMLRCGESLPPGTPPGRRLDPDSKQRIEMCLCALLDARTRGIVTPLLLTETRTVFAHMLSEKHKEEATARREKEAEIKALPFELLTFRQLKAKNALGTDAEIDDEGQLTMAVKGLPQGSSSTSGSSSSSSSSGRGGGGGGGPDAGAGGMGEDIFKAGHMRALTGNADPVYVEASVTVLDFDIVIEFLIINRTDQTLTNVDVELCVVGDLKLTDRPAPFTMAPRDYRTLTTNIKVSSTETGHIYGNVSFDHPQQVKTTIVALQEIHIDIMNYIRPATCTESEFRAMWAEFEWENKVAVFTVINDCNRFLEHIQRLTNMSCLTPPFALDDSCDFLAANLYATSIFGEAALLNISIEKAPSGKIEGYIRIRAKNQGIALSLGDRITMKQKGV